MKYIMICLSAIWLLSCSNGRNELMTTLLNTKKTAEDSIKLAHNYEGYYYDKAKEQMHSGADSTIWHKYVDSSTAFYSAQRRLKKVVAAVDFSIDSLSKMK